MSRAFLSAKAPRRLLKIYRGPVARAVQVGAGRRGMLSAGVTLGFALDNPLQESHATQVTMGVNMLSTFERADQRAEVLQRSQLELARVITSADAPKAVRLVLNDAGTFDAATGTGGFDGSIVLAKDEAGRPENAGLRDVVARIEKAKLAIDQGNAKLGAGPISWADALVLAAKVAVQAGWKDIKVSRAAVKSGGDTIAKAFGAQWDIKLGRLDSAEAAPPGRVLAPGADAGSVRAFMQQLGVKPGTGGPFSPKPPFWDRHAFVIWTAAQDDPAAAEATLASQDPEFKKWKATYDTERQTITRTTYEVDFINDFNKLTTLGARFNPDAYLHPVAAIRLS